MASCTTPSTGACDWLDFDVTGLNLFLLVAVAFLTFPTKLVAEAMKKSSRTPSAPRSSCTGATLLVISVLISRGDDWL